MRSKMFLVIVLWLGCCLTVNQPLFLFSRIVTFRCSTIWHFAYNLLSTSPPIGRLFGEPAASAA